MARAAGAVLHEDRRRVQGDWLGSLRSRRRPRWSRLRVGRADPATRDVSLRYIRDKSSAFLASNSSLLKMPASRSSPSFLI